jgi:WD40 repeat protein
MTTEMLEHDRDQYDVFLSYHWRDHSAVEQVARALCDHGLRVFLDRWYLTPGLAWPQALERTLEQCRAVAVFVGPEPLGSWQLREYFLALDRQSRDETFPVIPVLLPGADPPLGFLKLNTWVDLRSGVADAVTIEALVAAARGLSPGPTAAARVAAAVASVCPYRGLQVFREEDAPFFCGREAFTTKLVEEVNDKSFVAVVGASGSGKSSVVHAGLIPHLRADAGSQVWEVATLTPGDRPLYALAVPLLAMLEPDLGEVDRLVELNKLAEHLGARTVSLRDVVVRCLERQRGTDRLLLFIDQWEELYTLCADERARTCFIAEVLGVRAHAPVTVVLTLRGDFYGRALTDRVLADRLQDAVVNLGPMTRDELTRSITVPADKVGLSFEHGLVDRILDDVGNEPGNLPLLEFVLTSLWEQRRGRLLHFEAYQAMGGVQGAIATRAGDVFNRLTAVQRAAARQVLLQMVRLGEGTADTRRRASLPMQDQDALAVVRELANARLVVTGRDETRHETPTMEITHEALIHHWALLQQWVSEDREFLRTRERVEAAAALWEQEGRPHDRLLAPGRPLAEAEDLLVQRRGDLSAPLVEFIEASSAAEKAHQEAERVTERRRLRNTRLAAALLLLLFLSAAGLSYYAYDRRTAAEKQRQVAEQRRQEALARLLATQASILAERGRDDAAMRRATAFAIESWRRMPNADAHAVTARLLEWYPIMQPIRHIKGDPPGDWLRHLVLSPDGRFLVTMGSDVRLLEWASGKELTRIRGMGGSVTFAKFTPDSRILFIDGQEEARLVDTASGKELFVATASEFTTHTDITSLSGHPTDFRVGLVTLSPDGHWLAVTHQGRITIIAPQSGQEALHIAHQEAGPSLVFSPQGDLLAIQSESSYRLIEIPSGRERPRIPLTGEFKGGYFVGDGRYFANATCERLQDCGASATLHLYDTATSAELTSFHMDGLDAVKFAHEGQRIVTWDGQTARLLEAPTGKEVAHWQENSQVAWGSFDKQGRRLAIATKAGVVRLLEASTGKEVAHWQENSQEAWGSFDEQGRRLIIRTEAGVVRLIDAASGRQLFETNVACELDRVKRGDVLVVVCKNGPVHSFDAETGRALTRFELDGSVVQFSPNARLLLTFDKNRNLLKLVETRSGHQLASVDTPSDCASFLSTCFSSDSRHVAMPTVSGDVRLIDSDDLPSFHTLVWLELNHQGRAVLSHDGRLLAVDAPDHFVRIIDVATQREVALLQHGGSAVPVTFSPNDRLLMTYQDQAPTVHLMDVSSSREIASLPCEDSSVTSSVLHLDRLSREDSRSSVFDRAVFSSDSRLFAIQCDNVAQVIETDSGKVLAQVQYGEKPAGLALSPDGRLLGTTSAREGKARLTEVASGQDRFPITLAPGAYPLDVAFSPDRRTLALGLLGHVRLIDIATGKERVRLPPKSAGGMSLRPSFSQRLRPRCTMGGRTGRCPKRPRWTLRWCSHRHGRPIVMFRDACERHAREFAKRHGLQDV